MKDYYALLGIQPDSEPEEVKQAFRKLAQRLHPDVGGNEAEFMALKEAYDTLIDADLREAYDIAFVEAFPGYSLIDADTGEDLVVEYEDAPPPAAYQQRAQSRAPMPNPQPDNGRGLLMLVVFVVPILGFGFGMAITGDPLTSIIVALFLLLAMLAIAALVRERM